MIIELLKQDNEVFTIVETENPELEFESYKTMFPVVSNWREAEPILPTLDELKAKKRIEVDALTGQKITGGFNMLVNDVNTKFDSDIETQITMQGIAINANTEDFKIKYPDGAPVRGIPEGKTKKEVLMLDGPAIIKFCANLSEHIGQCKQRGWELQQAVDLAETVEDLEKIKW